MRCHIVTPYDLAEALARVVDALEATKEQIELATDKTLECSRLDAAIEAVESLAGSLESEASNY